MLARAVGSTCPAWLADRREDIVQNALVRVLEILNRGEETAAPSTSYVWRVGYHATLDEIRRRRRRPEERMDPADLDRAQGGSSPGPDRLQASREIGGAILECLSGMVRPRRIAVQLLLYGYDLSESARILGWSVKRADNLRSRGLADLRKCLRGKGVEP